MGIRPKIHIAPKTGIRSKINIGPKIYMGQNWYKAQNRNYEGFYPKLRNANEDFKKFVNLKLVQHTRDPPYRHYFRNDVILYYILLYYYTYL